MTGERNFGVGLNPITTVNSHLTEVGGKWLITADSPGRFGIAMLVPYFSGQQSCVHAYLETTGEQNLRVEVCGSVTRMQKAFVDFKGNGEISRVGEEVVTAKLALEKEILKISVEFSPYKTYLEWLYIFCEGKSEGASFFLNKADYNYDRPAAISPPQDFHFNVNSLSLYRSYLQIDFELLNMNQRLAGVRLKGDLAFETVQWWTSQDIAPNHSAIERPRTPKFPLPSPRAMEIYGEDFGWYGHSIRAIFSDFINVPHMALDESSRILDSLTLEAIFEDGSSRIFPVTLTEQVFPKKFHLEQLLDDEDKPADKNRVFLELGARGNHSSEIRKLVENNFRYIGVDIQEHPNVDVVGDAHQLSQYFQPESVDVVYSHSVLEHIIVPWKVVIESNRVLRIGGLFIAYAPVTWPLHAEPWDFWRISPHAWPAMLNEASGFEILSVDETGNASIVPLDVANSRAMSRMQHGPAPLFSSVVARKIRESTVDWDGWARALARGKYG